ncbi:hypothetical protein A2V82_00490 [candidate division KSB1 bacterium RBG_16_48_16]|nr:MAG: hypothetical protein A2V82_00490 [candidate division KSB1 bacterium RBG_16_48_16]
MFQSKLNRFFKRLPWTAAVTIAIVWGLVYLFFGRLHGMWDMFDRWFPFFIMRIIGMKQPMPVLLGLFFAMLDGAVLGFIFGGIVRMAFYRKE